MACMNIMQASDARVTRNCLRYAWLKRLYFVLLVFLTASYAMVLTIVNMSLYESNSIPPVALRQRLMVNTTLDTPAVTNATSGTTSHRSPCKRSDIHSNASNIFPNSSSQMDDRILSQLHFVPQNYNPSSKMKVILSSIHSQNDINDVYMKDDCLVNKCRVVIADENITESIRTADAVILAGDYGFENERPTGQIWIWSNLESPFHAGPYFTRNKINWTATYRLDSTIVTPYEKFVPYGFKTTHIKPIKKSANSTGLVVWFVSNCGPVNKRSEYADDLSQFVPVDIFGECGSLQCERFSKKCDDLLRYKYKFYLSFENSNCRDYITEKFFVNALQNDVVPIVMGGRKEDYLAVAPPNSFIHVEDFKSPKELADYLKLLDSNDHLYNKYFEWKGTGEFINTKYWCRVCAMLHMDPMPIMWYEDIEAWWKGPNTCTKDRWDRQEDYIKNWYGEY